MTFGTVTGACIAAGVDRKTWYNWVRDDETFAEHVASAKEQVADRLEQAAIERATAFIEPSDTLLIFLLKGLRREVYGDKREISGPDGGPIPISPVEKLSTQLSDIAKRRRAVGSAEQPEPEGG